MAPPDPYAPVRRGVILAGGRGRRLGGAKAAAPLAGSTLLGHAVALVRAAGLSPVVVARRDSALPQVDAELWLEPAGEAPHPLAGLAHALGTAQEPVVALPLDLPLLPPALLAALARAPGPLTVVAEPGAGERRPAALVLRAEPDLGAAIAAAAREGAPALRTLTALGARLRTPRELDPAASPQSLLNVNDAAALAQAERLLAGS